MKTPVTHDQMIKMFAQNQDATLEIVRAMETAVNATTRAETHRIDVKLDGVIKRQDVANDQVKKNTNKIYLMGKTIGVVNWLGNHIKLCLLALFGFCYLTALVYTKLDLFELILMIFKKV